VNSIIDVGHGASFHWGSFALRGYDRVAGIQPVMFLCFLGCTVVYALLSFDSPLRSGFSLHIEERTKYRFMKIVDFDFHFGAFGLAPSTYSRFLFPLPTAAATPWSSNSSRTIYLSTYLLFYARQFSLMENSQHPRRRNRSSNISQEQVTSPRSTTPPETSSEKTKEGRPRRLQRGSRRSMELYHHEEQYSSVRLQSLCFKQWVR
jgi:hypothetical protein